MLLNAFNNHIHAFLFLVKTNTLYGLRHSKYGRYSKWHASRQMPFPAAHYSGITSAVFIAQPEVNAQHELNASTSSTLACY